MEEPRVSIVLRSYNEAWALRSTLAALKAQDYRNWELIAFDSGSCDGSVEMIRQAGPAHFEQMLPHEYRPGRVLNRGMELAASDRVIFLNADATPQGQRLARRRSCAALADPGWRPSFGRQIPRPDCAAVFARDYERCFDGRTAVRALGRLLQHGEQRPEARRLGAPRLPRDHAVFRGRRLHALVPRRGLPRRLLPGLGRDALAQLHPPAGLQAQLRRGVGARRLMARLAREISARRAAPPRLAARRLRRPALLPADGPPAPARARAAIRWQQRLGRLHGFHAGWQMHRVDCTL